MAFDFHADLRRFRMRVRESHRANRVLIDSSRRAIEESRALLFWIAQQHPEDATARNSTTRRAVDGA